MASKGGEPVTDTNGYSCQCGRAYADAAYVVSLRERGLPDMKCNHCGEPVRIPSKAPTGIVIGCSDCPVTVLLPHTDEAPW